MLRNGHLGDQGFSLTEVLIAFALVGIAVSSSITLIENGQREESKLQKKVNYTNFKRSVEQIFNNKSACDINVINSDFTDPNSEVDLPGIKQNATTNLVEVGSADFVSEYNSKLTGIKFKLLYQMQDISIGTDLYKQYMAQVKLIVLGDVNNSTIENHELFTFPVRLDLAGEKVQECMLALEGPSQVIAGYPTVQMYQNACQALGGSATLELRGVNPFNFTPDDVRYPWIWQKMWCELTRLPVTTNHLDVDITLDSISPPPSLFVDTMKARGLVLTDPESTLYTGPDGDRAQVCFDDSSGCAPQKIEFTNCHDTPYKTSSNINRSPTYIINHANVTLKGHLGQNVSRSCGSKYLRYYSWHFEHSTPGYAEKATMFLYSVEKTRNTVNLKFLDLNTYEEIYTGNSPSPIPGSPYVGPNAHDTRIKVKLKATCCGIKRKVSTP